MRQIKFRGRRPNGQIIYGDLLHKKSAVMIAVTHVLKFHVEPDSVAQLVGFDSNGKEVYEGDKLIDCEGDEYTASICNPPQVTAVSTLKEGES